MLARSPSPNGAEAGSPTNLKMSNNDLDRARSPKGFQLMHLPASITDLVNKDKESFDTLMELLKFCHLNKIELHMFEHLKQLYEIPLKNTNLQPDDYERLKKRKSFVKLEKIVETITQILKKTDFEDR